MGEVDQVENAVNHGVAERDQGIDRADQGRLSVVAEKISKPLTPGVFG